MNVHVPNSRSNTALHYFCSGYTGNKYDEILAALIDRGSQVNYQNYRGEISLHRAVLNQTSGVEIARALITKYGYQQFYY